MNGTLEFQFPDESYSGLKSEKIVQIREVLAFGLILFLKIKINIFEKISNGGAGSIRPTECGLKECQNYFDFSF